MGDHNRFAMPSLNATAEPSGPSLFVPEGDDSELILHERVVRAEGVCLDEELQRATRKRSQTRGAGHVVDRATFFLQHDRNIQL